MKSDSLRVYLDFKSPAAYLGLNPLKALLQEYQIAAELLPFASQQQAVPPFKTDEDKGETHRRVRAQARQDTHLLYAQAQGLDMRFRAEPGDTNLALWVLANLPEPDRMAFASAAFTAYWSTDADLNSSAEVAGILQQAGLQTDLLHQAPEDLGAAMAYMREQAQEQDRVVDTPAFALAGQVFVGREHLPWIRQLLADDQMSA